MDVQTLRGHALVVVAVAAGIVGMGMVFSGAMDINIPEASRGVPLLLIGLWWAGRELGHNMDERRAQRRIAASRTANSSLPSGISPVGTARGH